MPLGAQDSSVSTATLKAIGQGLRAEYDVLMQPLSERLAVLVQQLGECDRCNRSDPEETSSSR